MHVLAAAEEFDLIGMDLAQKVVEKVWNYATDPPTMAELRQLARTEKESAQALQDQLKRRELPAPPTEVPAEVKAILAARRERWKDDPEYLRMRLRNARTPEEREEAARRLARVLYGPNQAVADLASGLFGDPTEGQDAVEEVPPGTPSRYREGMCTGVGKLYVLVGGVEVCPVCRSPRDEGCHPVATEQEVTEPVATQQSQGG